MNKKLLAVAISSALAAPMAAQAIEASVSGHVNRALMFVDDGQASDWGNVDSNASQSRLRVTGSGDLGMGGMKVGAAIEWAMGSNGSSAFDMKGANGNGGGNDSAFTLRHSRMWFSGGFGKVTMGHGSGAYDGVSYYADQAGSASLAGIINGGASFGGGIFFRTAAGGTSATQRVGNNFSTLGGTRYDNIRYDSPKIGPLSVAIDMGDDQRWGIAARMTSKFSGASVKAAIGYMDSENTRGDERWGFTGSVLFSQGTNINVAYAEQETTAGADSDTFYVKLGHRWGPEMVNSVAIDYQQVDDLTAAGSEATSWGIGFGHDIPGPGVNLYAGYKNWDLDQPGANFDDIDGFNMGARVKF